MSVMADGPNEKSVVADADRVWHRPGNNSIIVMGAEAASLSTPGLPGDEDRASESTSLAANRVLDSGKAALHVVVPGDNVSEGELSPANRAMTSSQGMSRSADGQAGLLYYIVGGATHQWIAFQGYAALPSGELKTEMANYLPTDPNAPAYGDYLNGQSVNEKWLDIIGPSYDNADHEIVPGDAVVQGAYEEDAEGVLDGTIDGVHFCNPDGGHNAGLVLSGTAYPSALQEAQEETFIKALAAYPDRKAEAYYWLGRTAHLLADVSVPAHTHLDPHSGLGTDDDQYEQEVAAGYKDITSASPNAQIPSTFPLAVPSGYPATYNPELSSLFYNLAKTAKQYDSDDVNGTSSEFGMGKYRSARNALTPGKTVSRAEYWDTDLGVLSNKRRDLVLGTDYAIQALGEFRIYYYQAFYDDINSSSRAVRVFYTDGSDESFLNLDETAGDVFNEPLHNIYQPNLEARAIGYTAALYQLFWAKTNPTPPPPPATFHITSIRRVVNTGPAVELIFPSESAATYRVQHSPTLSPAAAWTDAGVSATGTGAELTITAPDPVTQGSYFFRVVKM